MTNHAGRDRLISYWSRHLLTVLGVRIQAEHAPSLQGGALLVCNHVSWLDIYLIHSARRVYFVSKSEVRGWPILGWLAQQGGTLLRQPSCYRPCAHFGFRHKMHALGDKNQVDIQPRNMIAHQQRAAR